MKTDPSNPESEALNNSGQNLGTNASVGAVLDELEQRARRAHSLEAPFTGSLRPTTALALIEVARRVERLTCTVQRDARCDPPETHLLSERPLPDEGLPDYVEVLPNECPVCALGRLTEGRAE